jgi:hypothetical protein
VEYVNDLDGMVANFWRAVRYSPAETAAAADRLAIEVDLWAGAAHCRQAIPTLTAALQADHRFHDPELAGLWCWCVSSSVSPADWLHKTRPTLNANRQGVHAGNRVDRLPDVFAALHRRMRRVAVLNGDWTRALRDAITTGSASCGVFLDPPYLGAFRDPSLYATDDHDVANDVREWCIENGTRPGFRIVLAGLEGEHELPGWRVVAWSSSGGLHGGVTAGGTARRENVERHTERLWLSPGCHRVKE